jgi:hypothetical protein
MNKSLPSEVLKEVFTYLPKNACFKNIHLVCRQWYRISRTMCPLNACIRTPNDIAFTKLLDDLKKYPPFNYKIKKLIISQHDRDDVEMDHKFSSLVQFIPNLKEVELNMSTHLDRFSTFLNQLQLMAKRGEIKLQSLVLSAPICSGNYGDFLVAPSCRINLRHLFNNFSKELSSFAVNSNSTPCLCGGSIVRWPIHFSSLGYGELNSNNCLERTHIVNGYCTMNREYLNYIISGHLKNLKVLELYVVMRNKERKEDVIWDRLRSYCITSLESYNIYIRGAFSNLLFKLDN